MQHRGRRWGLQQDYIGLSQRGVAWWGASVGGEGRERAQAGRRGRTGLGGLPSSGASAAPAAWLAGLSAAADCLPAFLPVEGRPMLLQCSWCGRRGGGLFHGVDRQSIGRYWVPFTCVRLDTVFRTPLGFAGEAGL
eukprot:scaffold9825_cov48-Phaeocystis_antarctica.AAC.3